MSIAGPIDEVSIDGRPFAVAADADVSRKLGGFENEYSPNGNGTARKVMSRVAWSLTGLTLDVDDTQNDQEFLQDLADGDSDVAITVTYVSGAVYQGVGGITGELAQSNQSSTASVDLGGPGKLTPQ